MYLWNSSLSFTNRSSVVALRLFHCTCYVILFFQVSENKLTLTCSAFTGTINLSPVHNVIHVHLIFVSYRIFSFSSHLFLRSMIDWLIDSRFGACSLMRAGGLVRSPERAISTQDSIPSGSVKWVAVNTCGVGKKRAAVRRPRVAYAADGANYHTCVSLQLACKAL